jgi:RimJ/RimL family protein N-acetyltransferase
MTFDIRQADSVRQFAAVETAPEHVDDTARYLEGLFASGSSRPEWCFVAWRDGRPCGRVAFWALPRVGRPLDIVLLNLPWEGEADAIGRALLEGARRAMADAGLTTVGHCHDHPPRTPQWQTHGDARLALLAGLGFRTQRDTLRFEAALAPGAAVDTGDLRLRAATSDDEALLRQMVAAVAAASRDQIDIETVAARGAQAHAAELIADLRSMRVDPGWWQIAFDAQGTAVGLVLPVAGADFGSIGYIGVLPAHRGRGHVDVLLAAATALLREAGLPRLIADTDRSNTGMARAFTRGGWRQFGERRELLLPA